MNSVGYTESQENKKKSVAKCYVHWEVNPGPLTLVPCMLLSELIPLFAESLSPLDLIQSCSIDSKQFFKSKNQQSINIQGSKGM